jgi:putative flippase GtrA
VRLGVYSVVASVLSFAAAVTSNFIWNRYWTYPDSRAKPIAQQAMQFTLVNLIGLAIRTPIFALSEAPMTRLAAWVKTSLPAGMPEPLVGLPDVIIGRNLALGLAVIVVLFWNFGVNRIWTYSDIS